MTHFFVPGTPAPQGSKKYVGHRAGKPVLIESSAKVKPWRAAVAQIAALMNHPDEDTPVAVALDFIMPRPKTLPKRVVDHIKKPDLDKLTRSTLDALSGIAYTDDSRVVALTATKRYQTPGQPTGAHITITPLEGTSCSNT